MFKCQNIARDRRSELIKVVCAACAGSHEVESSKCGQRSTLLLVAGRRRVEVLPPFLFFLEGGRDHPISQKRIVPALFR